MEEEPKNGISTNSLTLLEPDTTTNQLKSKTVERMLI
jgi:hypothetical protein